MAETKKFQIHVKGGFSERKGIKNFSDVVQIDNLNERTRNRLYTCNEEIIERIWNKTNFDNDFVEYIYLELFSLIKDDIPYNRYDGYYNVDKIMKELYEFFKTTEYNFIFDFIEGIMKFFKMWKLIELKKFYAKSINDVLEKENVNYRIVNDIVTNFTTDEEISEINCAIKNPYAKVSEHLQKALEKLYHDKDYSNSIKESISAVESMCQVMLNNDKATLGQALKSLKIKIHPALNAAFDKLYGYTSDANGIRHANGLAEGESTFSEAKFMLVSCSAFINYLKENFENK